MFLKFVKSENLIDYFDTMRGYNDEVLESKNGAVTIEYQGKVLTAVLYHQMQARTEEVSSKELLTKLVEKPRYTPKPGRYHPWKRGRRGFSKRTPILTSCY